MSEALELLNGLSQEELGRLSGVGDAEAHIVIGQDRFITVPLGLRRIAVEHDHNIETVTFDCPRYWDDNDLSTMAISINYMLPNGYTDRYPVSNIRADGDYIHFDWTISRNVTQVKGQLAFLICAVTTGEDDGPHWNSELNRDMFVSEGMECEAGDIIQDPDALVEVLKRLTYLENNKMVAGEGITPQMFGATGKRSEDATKAFQDALDAAKTAKTSVLLPGGEYTLKSPIEVPEGVSIFGVNKQTCIVYSHGINLTVRNTLSNFSIYTDENDYDENKKSNIVDLVNISSSRMPWGTGDAYITISDMHFRGQIWPGRVSAYGPNMITIGVKDVDLAARGFFGVTIENVTSDYYFNYGVYCTQHYTEDKWGAWISKIRLSNVFINNPRWGIKGEVFVDEGLELSPSSQYVLGLYCQGVNGQYANDYSGNPYSIGFLDCERLKANIDGSGLSDSGGFNIVIRDPDYSEINLTNDSYLGKYSTISIALPKDEDKRHLQDDPTATPTLVNESEWWQKHRCLSNYSNIYRNFGDYITGRHLSIGSAKHDSESEANNLGKPQYWPMFRSVEFSDTENAHNMGEQYTHFTGLELLNSGSSGATSITPGILGFNKNREPVYSRRTKDAPHYTLHRMLTEEYMPHGTTEKRMVDAKEGVMYFDTELGRPVWSDGNGNWLDPVGDIDTAVADMQPVMVTITRQGTKYVASKTLQELEDILAEDEHRSIICVFDNNLLTRVPYNHGHSFDFISTTSIWQSTRISISNTSPERDPSEDHVKVFEDRHSIEINGQLWDEDDPNADFTDTINGMIDDKIGEIEAVLDELHAYAQALVNGGAGE